MPSKKRIVPSPNTDSLLGSLKLSYRKGEGREEETPEQLKERMLKAMNEELTFEELEQALPEEYRQYLIRDPEVQKEREAVSRKVRDIRADSVLGYIGKDQDEPHPINRSGPSIQAYLKRNGQEELAAEYEKVMDASPERQKALENAGGYAENNVSLAAYDRGHMIARVCEPFQNYTIESILNMSPQEKLAHMEELLIIYSIGMNTETILNQRERDRVHSLVKFSAPDRELCNHVHDLMDVTGTVTAMANLMTNPCYKYLDLERLCREQDLLKLSEKSVDFITKHEGAISRLGQELGDTATKVQRENGIRIEEQLKNLGMNMKEAVWTRPDGTRLTTEGMDGISYITEGKPAIVTDGKLKYTVAGGRGQEIKVRPYVPADDRIPRLGRKLKELGFDPELAMFVTADRKLFDPANEKDAAAYAEGKTILVTQGDRQIIIQGCDKNGDPAWDYTGFHYTNEYQRLQADNRAAEASAQQQEEAGRRQITDHTQQMAEAASVVETTKTRQLAGVRKAIRKAESIFVKGSPEFRSIKAALKEYAHMPAIDANDPESVETVKQLLEQINHTAQTYLGGKEGDGTTRLERKRVRAVRQVQQFVQQQLEQLGVVEEHENAITAQEQAIDARRESIQKSKAKEEELRATMQRYCNSLSKCGFRMPENVQKFYEEKTKQKYLQGTQKLADAEYPVETPNTMALDGELLDILEQYQQQASPESWNAVTPLTGEIKKTAEQLMLDMTLKTAIRNDQYAHPDNPTAGAINRLAENLELAEMKKVVRETPTMKALLKDLSGQKLVEYACGQSAPAQKEKLLKVMNEIPGTALTMLKGMPENARNLKLIAGLSEQKVQKPPVM